MLKNRFVKNTSWLLIGQVFRMSISFIINILIARYLGPENNGIINYVSSYMAFFTSMVGLGLNGVIVYEFVNRREREGEILGTAIVLRLLAGIISLFLFLIIIFATDGNEKIIIHVAILQSIQLPLLCLDTFNYWYQSDMNSKYPVIVQTIAYVFMTIYRIYLLLNKKSIVWFAFAVTLDIILLGILYLLLYNHHKRQKLSCSAEWAKYLLKSGFPFILADIMVVIYGQIDRIMIKHMMNSNAEVGLYSAAITICSMIGFIPIAILDSARPLIAEAKKCGEEIYALRFRQLVAGIMWLSFLFSVFITVFSSIIIRIMYGAEYSGANTCLKIVVWYTAFSYLGSAKNYWLICENKKKYVFIFSALGAGCNVIMNSVFIPFWGIDGAAIATLLTQILSNFVIPLAIKPTREYGIFVIDALLLRNIQLEDIIKMIKSRLIKH